MTEPLRVLQLITELEPGGAERIVYELAKGLPRERFAVQVCSLRPATGAVAGWLREAQVPVHSLGMCCKFDLRAPLRLARILRGERIQILHSHLFHANLIARLAAGGNIGRVSTVHIAERRRRPWRFWLDRWTLGRNERVVCVSEAVRKFTEERTRIPAARMRVIPNGVDLKRFASASDPVSRNQARERLRKAFGLAEEALVVLAAGRLRPQKGFSDLLEAWALALKNSRPETERARLLIAGDGPERAALAARMNAPDLTGRVQLLGQREDLPELMAGADLFVLSSRYEGFGLVVVEAMAARLPVVATAVESIGELLGDSGAGLVAPVGDAGRLAEALGKLLGMTVEERERMGAAGQVRAQAFSLEKMLERYAILYGEVMLK